MKKLPILIFIFILSFEIYAQNDKPQKTVRENGWNISSIHQILKSGPEIVICGKEMERLEESKKFVNWMHCDLSSPILVRSEDFFTDEEISRRTENIKPLIFRIEVYSLDKRIFAYKISFKFISESGNTINYLGCITFATYMDEDGDGKFETRTDELEEIPKWVEQ